MRESHFHIYNALHCAAINIWNSSDSCKKSKWQIKKILLHGAFLGWQTSRCCSAQAISFRYSPCNLSGALCILHVVPSKDKRLCLLPYAEYDHFPCNMPCTICVPLRANLLCGCNFGKAGEKLEVWGGAPLEAPQPTKGGGVGKRGSKGRKVVLDKQSAGKAQELLHFSFGCMRVFPCSIRCVSLAAWYLLFAPPLPSLAPRDQNTLVNAGMQS